MTSIEQLLDRLESTAFRFGVDCLSSRRGALTRLQEDATVRQLAAKVAASPELVAPVVRRMRDLARRPQEAGTIHDFDATLSALAVAILIAHRTLRPVIERVSNGIETMWLAHVVAEHRRTGTSWPALDLGQMSSSPTASLRPRLAIGSQTPSSSVATSTAGTTQVAA